MLFPAILSLAFRRGNQKKSLLKWVHQSPKQISLEVRKLLPEMSETISLAELYFNALNDKDGDELDGYISGIIVDVRELFRIVSNSKSSWVMSLFLRIRRDVEKIPRMITHLMYHSKSPSQQAELSKIRQLYESHVGKDSLLSDMLAFIREYFFIRWKGSESLRTKVTQNVSTTLDQNDTDSSR